MVFANLDKSPTVLQQRTNKQSENICIVVYCKLLLVHVLLYYPFISVLLF